MLLFLKPSILLARDTNIEPGEWKQQSKQNGSLCEALSNPWGLSNYV